MRPALAVGLLLACIGVSAAEVREPGKPCFGRERYVEYIPGTLPIVLSAPHGGREKPTELPDRTEGTFAFDVNTQELARAIDEAFVSRTGQPLGCPGAGVTTRVLAGFMSRWMMPRFWRAPREQPRREVRRRRRSEGGAKEERM